MKTDNMKTEPQRQCSDCIYFHMIDDDKTDGDTASQAYESTNTRR
jgi:hypothetical protein